MIPIVVFECLYSHLILRYVGNQIKKKGLTTNTMYIILYNTAIQCSDCMLSTNRAKNYCQNIYKMHKHYIAEAET